MNQFKDVFDLFMSYMKKRMVLKSNVFNDMDVLIESKMLWKVMSPDEKAPYFTLFKEYTNSQLCLTVLDPPEVKPKFEETLSSSFDQLSGNSSFESSDDETSSQVSSKGEAATNYIMAKRKEKSNEELTRYYLEKAQLSKPIIKTGDSIIRYRRSSSPNNRVSFIVRKDELIINDSNNNSSTDVVESVVTMPEKPTGVVESVVTMPKKRVSKLQSRLVRIRNSAKQ